MYQSLSESYTNNAADDAAAADADDTKYKWTRFIFFRKSARTSHSISVASSYSFIFGLMEHNPVVV